MTDAEQLLDQRRWLLPLLLACLCFTVVGPRLLAVPSGQMLDGGNDIKEFFYPYLTYVTESIRAGEFPLWNPHQFAGYSVVANPQLGLFYPATWLMLILPVNVGLALSTFGHLWLAGMGMAALMRSLGSTNLGALLAGIVFVFSENTFARIWAGHYTVLIVSCWLPWTAWAYRWAVQRESISAALLAGAVLAMPVLGGHSTTLLYVAIVLGAFWLYEMALRKHIFLPTRQLALAGLFAGVIAAVQLLPAAEMATGSARSTLYTLDFAGRYFMPAVQLVTGVIADLFGSPVSGNYWGGEGFHGLAFYCGLFPLLGVLFAFRKRSPAGWLFIGLGVIGILISLGNAGAVFPVLYWWMPLFRLIRGPGRALLLVVFALAGLAAILLSWLQRAEPAARHALCRLWAHGTRRGLLVLAVLAISVAILNQATKNDVHLEHASNAIAYAALIVAALSAIFGQWSTVRTTKSVWFASLLIGLTIMDLWRVDVPLVAVSPIEPSPPWEALRKITGETGDFSYRVALWNITKGYEVYASMLGYYSVNGYDPISSGVHSTFLGSVRDPRATTYKLLNTRYIVTRTRLDLPPIEGAAEVAELGQVGEWYVYKLMHDQPRAFVARSVEIISDDEAALARIHGPGFDPAEHVIVDRTPDCLVGGGEGRAAITAYGPNRVVIAVESETSSLMVLSDAYYSGWVAEVDGRPVDILRANTLLRAVCVPDGVHTVTMTFQPMSFYIGALISLGGVAVAGIVVVRLLWRRANSNKRAA